MSSNFGIGLGLALLVNQRSRAAAFSARFIMLPWAMPAFVAFLTWRVLYQPIGGGINLILTETGIYPEIIDWLGQTSTAMPAVIIATVWRGFPFWFISLLAALQAVRPISTRRRGSTARMPGSASGRSHFRRSGRSSSSRPCSPRSGPPIPSKLSGC